MNKIIAAAIAAAVMMPAASFAADSSPSVKIGGGIQADYRTGKNDVTGTQQHEFNMRRARLIVNGKVNDLIGYGVTVQGDNSGGTIFRDMFATLNFNPLAKVTVGQFKYEFDLEGRESSFDRSFMDRTYVTNAVAGGASGDFRDKGAQLSGAMDMDGMGGGYAVGVFNGNGGAVSSNPQDNNNSLMYTANLFVSPIKGVKVNGGYMHNERANEGSAITANINNWTVGAAYDAGPLFARGEYYKGKIPVVTGTPTALVGTANIKGWYVMGGFSVTPVVDLMARYQTVKSGDIAGSKLSSVDLGAKYYLAKKGKRGGSNVAVNYMIRNADANAATTILNDGRGSAVAGGAVDNVLAARLQVAF